MADVRFLRGKVALAGPADWGSSSQEFGILLASADYQPKVTHRFVSDVAGELAGGGYARQMIAGRKVVENEKTDKADCLADVVTFDDLATKQSYRWAIVFRKGARDSSSDLICAIDMEHVDLSRQASHTIRWSGEKKTGRVFSLG